MASSFWLTILTLFYGYEITQLRHGLFRLLCFDEVFFSTYTNVKFKSFTLSCDATKLFMNKIDLEKLSRLK
jgi:hypothetical protein